MAKEVWNAENHGKGTLKKRNDVKLPTDKKGRNQFTKGNKSVLQGTERTEKEGTRTLYLNCTIFSLSLRSPEPPQELEHTHGYDLVSPSNGKLRCFEPTDRQ